MTSTSAPAIDYERDATLLALVRSLIDMTSRTDSRQIALLLYLVDWRAALTHGSQATSIRWHLDIRGPKTRFIEEIVKTVRSERGRMKGMIKGLRRRPSSELDEVSRAALDYVLTKTSRMQFQELARNVLATWPILQSNADSARDVADLVTAAKTYRESGKPID